MEYQNLGTVLGPVPFHSLISDTGEVRERLFIKFSNDTKLGTASTSKPSRDMCVGCMKGVSKNQGHVQDLCTVTCAI